MFCWELATGVSQLRRGNCLFAWVGVLLHTKKWSWKDPFVKDLHVSAFGSVVLMTPQV